MIPAIAGRPRTLRDTPLKGRVVVIESPYQGEVDRNIAYLHQVMREVFRAGGVPFASHGIFPGPLADANADERLAWILAGYEIGRRAADGVLYAMDYGISDGMVLSVPIWLNHQIENPGFVVDVMCFSPSIDLRVVEADLFEHVKDRFEPARIECPTCRGRGARVVEFEISDCETCAGLGTVRHWVRRK